MMGNKLICLMICFACISLYLMESVEAKNYDPNPPQRSPSPQERGRSRTVPAHLQNQGQNGHQNGNGQQNGNGHTNGNGQQNGNGHHNGRR
ncbi:uncharacterized protein LOC126889688 [Diabrotica virgifera virgifera]|uniref:Uncharacterized protein n=1 Tax=Diabrotica virgifera virgifera TaxID=50390 RepID=A0ABM5KVE3_DIAVI|nr:uncharacterized protein LOC126889688 [Diabrotica virgifera virgifera]